MGPEGSLCARKRSLRNRCVCLYRKLLQSGLHIEYSECNIFICNQASELIPSGDPLEFCYTQVLQH